MLLNDSDHPAEKRQDGSEANAVLDNPLWNALPPVPNSVEEALKLIAAHVEKDNHAARVGLSDIPAEVIANDIVFCPQAAHGRIIRKIVALTRESAWERNLLSMEYAEVIQDAHLTLRSAQVRRAQPAPISREVIEGKNPRIARLSRAPRGYVVAMPLQTGRHTLARVVQSVLGRETAPRFLDWPNGGQIMCSVVRSVRVTWPPDGSPGGFFKAFALAVDAERKYYSNEVPIAFFSLGLRGDRDFPSMLESLANAVSLGCLIVERVNARIASSLLAQQTWQMLARFTFNTGIPVVTFATPAAVINGLAPLQDAAVKLASAGLDEVLPKKVANDPHWAAVTCAHHDRHIAPHTGKVMPDWLPSSTFAAALGHEGLCASAIKAHGDYMKLYKKRKLDQQQLERGMSASQRIFRNAMKAKLLVEAGASLDDSKMRIYGDWLTFAQVSAADDGLLEA